MRDTIASATAVTPATTPWAMVPSSSRIAGAAQIRTVSRRRAFDTLGADRSDFTNDLAPRNSPHKDAGPWGFSRQSANGFGRNALRRAANGTGRSRPARETIRAHLAPTPTRYPLPSLGVMVSADQMIKSQLVGRIATRQSHLSHRDINKLVNAVIDRMTAAMALGDRVELRGFGVFSVKIRSARIRHNPRSGVLVSVPRTCIPAFRTAKDMHRRLNRNEQKSLD